MAMTDNSTASIFAEQWRNPAGFLSLLMIMGGPVIQLGLAQLTGPSFVPICFSFGWVSYAFSTISALVGDGRLMPPTDYNCKVINLENGYTRMNRSWVIGRLLRDLEKPLSTEALRVDVYEAADPLEKTLLLGGKSTWFALAVILLQLSVAAIPFGVSGDWGILLITLLGNSVAVATAALPQWRIEKFACRIKSKKKIAITTGNGSRYVVVILGEGKCLDIEDLAMSEGPRQARPWENAEWCVRYVDSSGERVQVSRTQALKSYMRHNNIKSSAPKFLAGTWIGMRCFQWHLINQSVPKVNSSKAMEAYLKNHNLKKEVSIVRGLPLPFIWTRLLCVSFILCWTVILISVSALRQNAWYLIAVGAAGMLHNALVAAAARKPESRGIYLKQKPMIFVGDKVMDVLMDLDRWEAGCGRHLLKEFFPAGLDIPKNRGEVEWWDIKARQDKNSRAASEGGRADWSSQLGKYDNDRYSDQNAGKRYNKEEVEGAGMLSRGGRWGGIRRE